MKKTPLLLFFCVLLFSSIIAQKEEKTVQPDSSYKMAVKLNVLSLVDYTPSAQFAFQYKVGRSFYIQHEIGYITHYLSPFWDNSSNLNGYRLKSQAKLKINNFKNGSFLYTGLDLMYKSITYRQEDEFTFFENAYFQKINYGRKKNASTATFLFGYEPNIGNKLVLDVFIGLGIRYVDIKEKDIPFNAVRLGRGIFGNKTEGTYFLPNVSLGLRMGYILK